MAGAAGGEREEQLTVLEFVYDGNEIRVHDEVVEERERGEGVGCWEGRSRGTRACASGVSSAREMH